MKKLSIFFVFLFMNNGLLRAQKNSDKGCISPLYFQKRFDFEENNMFDKNEITSLYASVDGYVIEKDSVVSSSGKNSLKMIGSNPDNMDFGAFNLTSIIPVDKGYSVVLTADIKTASLEGAGEIEFVGYNKKRGTNPVFFKNVTIPVGTNEWTTLRIEIPVVKEDITSIFVRGTMQGSGLVWYDNFKVMVNGQELEQFLGDKYLSAGEMLQEEIKALGKYVYPFKTVDPTQSDFSDFTSVKKYLSNAEVIGLGEATHGTREIFQFKHRFFEFLVQELGFEVFAFEAYLPNAFAVNDYVLNGKGNPKELVQGMEFWTWSTEEVLDLVKWMRNYNESHTKKVQFAGFDMQNNTLAIDNLLAAFDRNSKVMKSLNIYMNFLQTDTIPSDKTYSKKLTLAKEVRNKVYKNTKDVYLLKNADVLVQDALMPNYESESDPSYAKAIEVRDRLMAENVIWLKEVMFKGKKIVLWAHDSHIQKDKGVLGGFLYDKLGDKYVNFGFVINKGSYKAVDFNEKGGVLKSNNPLTAGNCGSLEILFERFQQPYFLFNNYEASKDIKLHSFYKKIITKRSIAAAVAKEQFELQKNLKVGYNFLVYIENTSATVGLK